MSSRDKSIATVCLLPWGNLIEDFLDTIGISLDEFCERFTGSFVFGFAAALNSAGMRTVVICISARVDRTAWLRHGPTGAAICILPAPRLYRFLMRLVRNPYARTVDGMFHEHLRRRRILRPVLRVLQQVLGYVATPPILLARAMRTAGCNVVLCQEYEFPRFDICVALGRFLGLPVFATFQGGDYQRWRIERLIRPLAIRHCRGLIISASHELRRVQTEYRVPSAKLAHVVNPVDLGIWQPVPRDIARARIGLPGQARIVIWHGRISRWKKGLDTLADAWQALSSEHSDVELVLLGDGEDAEWLHGEIGRRGLAGIHWHRAFLHDRNVIRMYLSAADVYVFPSRHEGLAIAPLEAMACGLPVVASDIPSMRDVLTADRIHGGLVVPREDAHALAAAIWRVLADASLREHLGRGAQARAVAFSPESVGPQLRAFLLQGSAMEAAAERPSIAGEKTRFGARR